MSTLQGQFINDSYRDLLQISNSNIGIDETSRYIEDGEGTPSILSLSTTRVGVGTTSPAYTLDVAGDINLTGSLKVNGADAVFSNWTVNGSDVYRSAGNVGIGVSSPSRALHVAGDINVDTGDAYMWQSGEAALRSSNKDIIFETYNTSPGTLTEKMKITAEGLVRIGGGTPGHILDVQTSWTNTFLARLDNLGGDSSAHGLLVKVARNDSNGILLGVHNSEEYKLYVRADGNVGVGTTSPGAKLHVDGDAIVDELWLGGKHSIIPSDNTKKWIKCAPYDWSGSTNPDTIAAISMGTDHTGHDDGNIDFYTATNENTSTGDSNLTHAMRINSAGKVGIGTTDPIVPLHIKGNVVTEEQMLGGSGSGMLILETIETQPEASDVGRLTIGILPYKQNENGNWLEGNSFIAARTADLLLQPANGNVCIGTTESYGFRFCVDGRSHFVHASDGSVATMTQNRNTSNAGLFGNGTTLGGFQGSLNLWTSNSIAETDPGGLAGCLVDEFVSLDFTAAYASNSTTTAGWTCGRIGTIFEGLTQYQSGQPTTQNRATSMGFAVSTPGGTVEERMRIKSDGHHIYKATNSSQDDMWTLRRGFYIGADVRRRVRIILSNYEAVYIRIAAQRTNSGDSMVWYHGYFSYNFNERYTNAIDSRMSSGTISITSVSSINGGQAYFDFDFNVSASPAKGSIVVESVAGNATVQVTTY